MRPLVGRPDGRVGWSRFSVVRMTARDTLFALSSGRGKAAVAVVRLSGPEVERTVRALAGRVPLPRRASLARLTDPDGGALLDRALILWLPGPGTFTGEDMAELHLHGGAAVVAGVLDILSRVPGLRPAAPGAFTRRAFENGKMDLTGVEALADLIDAETEAQRVQALRLDQEGLGRRAEGWRADLLRAMALTEAAIDFSDEVDVAETALADARKVGGTLLAGIRSVLADGRRGEIIRDGFRVVIVGAPNVGKSSLLNALARRDVAIVSDEAGTTRDVLEVRLDLEGLAVSLSDTAGLRASAGAVEREGMRRAVALACAADLVVRVTDAAEPAGTEYFPPELHRNLEADRTRLLDVVNKVDQVPEWRSSGSSCIGISARTGAGLSDLLSEIGRRAGAAAARQGEPPLITRARQRSEIAAAESALADFISGDAAAPELRAEDLRRAADALGRLTGRVDVEDVLGEIFSRFCIGK